MSRVMLQILTHRLDHGSSLNLSIAPPGKATDEHLDLVIGGGRGCSLKIDGEIAGIWMPIRGRLHLQSATGDSIVMPRKFSLPSPRAGSARVAAVMRYGRVWSVHQVRGALLFGTRWTYPQAHRCSCRHGTLRIVNFEDGQLVLVRLASSQQFTSVCKCRD